MKKMNIKLLINQFRLLFTYTKNPISTLLFYLGLKSNLNCNLKSYGKILLKNETKHYLGQILYTIDQLEQYNLDKKSAEFKEFLNRIDEKIWIINGVKFYNSEYNNVLWEYFHDNPFLREDFNKRTIIDIGANVGDTALFMANAGATVYAFEPVPETYEMALKNLSLNPKLENKIHLFQNAIDGEHKNIRIYTEDYSNATASSFIETNHWTDIEAFKLEEIMEKYDIKPDILKLDCEGAEYSILDNSDLSEFNEILMEYHEEITGISHEILINNLVNMNFNVKIKNIKPYSLNELGFILATKKPSK